MNGFTVYFSFTKNKYKSTHKACPKWVYRMLVPSLTKAGHQVVIEQDAALTSGYLDDEYLKAGARIEQNRSRLFEQSEIKIRPWKGGFKITSEGFNFEIRNNIKYAIG